MTIGPILLKVLDQIENEGCAPKIKEILKEQIESASVDVTATPRDSTDGNKMLLCSTVQVALLMVECVYGDGDDSKFLFSPYFKSGKNSQIGFDERQAVFAIGLGGDARTWEEVFYDICHESVHLLNPIAHVEKENVSALEEGCAVKFAEEMYEKYITPYCNKVPLTSPIIAPSSQYFQAYSATKKIPNSVLKKVREEFGRFANIDNAEKFTALVDKFVSADEIQVLIKPFEYKRNAPIQALWCGRSKVEKQE